MKKSDPYYVEIDAIFDDDKRLKKLLDERFIDVVEYDEEKSVKTSRAFVENVVNRLDGENDEMLINKLVRVHNQYGSHNGGCILYDYLTTSNSKIRKLLQYDKIKNLYKKNQEEALRMGDDFCPRLIFPINLKSKAFMRELEKAYPKLASRENDEEQTI